MPGWIRFTAQMILLIRLVLSLGVEGEGSDAGLQHSSALYIHTDTALHPRPWVCKAGNTPKVTGRIPGGRRVPLTRRADPAMVGNIVLAIVRSHTDTYSSHPVTCVHTPAVEMYCTSVLPMNGASQLYQRLAVSVCFNMKVTPRSTEKQPVLKVVCWGPKKGWAQPQPGK